MQIAKLAGLATLVVALGSPAFAGPITGADTPPAAPPAQGASQAAQGGAATDTSFSAGALFDPVGNPLLRTSGPIYLELGARGKLRGGGIAGDYGGGGGGYSSSGGPGAPGAPGGGGPPAIGNVNPELPLGGGGDPLGGIGPVAIPEPAALLLLAPGIALALRRRARARR
jgi:hypothetical protein